MRVLTRRRKAAMASVAIALFAGSVTWVGARWLANGEGTGQARAGVAQELTVTEVTPTSDLYPGGTANVGVTIANPNPYPVVIDLITQIEGQPITSDTAGCDSSNHAVTFIDQTGAWDIAANDSLELQLQNAAAMGLDSVSACQGAVFSIPLRVEGAAGDSTNTILSGADSSTCDPAAFEGAPTANELAGALGLCAATAGTAGLVNAVIAQGDDTTLSPFLHTGVLPDFGGAVPLQDSTFAVLSTGTAREASDPGYIAPVNGYAGAGLSTKPADLVAGSPDPSCPRSTNVYDDPTLTLTLRAPSTATGFSFDYNFFTASYPSDTCTDFTDNFYVTMDPAPVGSTGGNIAFDLLGNPVTAASVQHCDGCLHGTSLLTGSGYELHGATGWLPVTAAVTGGTEFTLVFRLWDTGDQLYDSLVLLDDFRWTTT